MALRRGYGLRSQFDIRTDYQLFGSNVFEHNYQVLRTFSTGDGGGGGSGDGWLRTWLNGILKGFSNPKEPITQDVASSTSNAAPSATQVEAKVKSQQQTDVQNNQNSNQQNQQQDISVNLDSGVQQPLVYNSAYRIYNYIRQSWHLTGFSQQDKRPNIERIGNSTVVETQGSSVESSAGLLVSDSSTSDALSVAQPAGMHKRLPIVGLPYRPLLPGTIVPHLTTDMALVQELLQKRNNNVRPTVGAFLKRDPNHLDIMAPNESYVVPHLYNVGTFGQVHNIVINEGQDSAQILLQGHRRIRLINKIKDKPLIADCYNLSEVPIPPGDEQGKAFVIGMIASFRELVQIHPLYQEILRHNVQFGMDLQQAARIADVGITMTSSEKEQMQLVLEELDVTRRCQMVYRALKREEELVRLQASISKQVEEKVAGEQRRWFLQEQLRQIKKELGLEKDEKSGIIQKYHDRFAEYRAGAPEAVVKLVEEELGKLAQLDPLASEFNITRNYLDWLTAIPWGHYSDDVLDVVRAKKILDQDHYGLADVKDRILEFIAVGTLRGSITGKILCLVGPPGVGKTSIGRSIAHALNRKYYRFSVGGLSDVAEIKGHRRTYIGAMPGKLVQCLKSVGTSNPMVLIDEIDKLGRGWQGDPASALLEVLDPEQNSGFLDHYLDAPVDLSKVLFVCTANQLETIPGPLLDRMEVIRLSGYINSEKQAIARHYLEPQALNESGVPPRAVLLTDPALDTLINEYCREAGVRSLKKQLDKIYRKAALKLVQDGQLRIEQEPVYHPADASKEGSSSGGGSGSKSTEKEPAPSTPTTALWDMVSGYQQGLKASPAASLAGMGATVGLAKYPTPIVTQAPPQQLMPSRTLASGASSFQGQQMLTQQETTQQRLACSYHSHEEGLLQHSQRRSSSPLSSWQPGDGWMPLQLTDLSPQQSTFSTLECPERLVAMASLLSAGPPQLGATAQLPSGSWIAPNRSLPRHLEPGWQATSSTSSTPSSGEGSDSASSSSPPSFPLPDRSDSLPSWLYKKTQAFLLSKVPAERRRQRVRYYGDPLMIGLEQLKDFIGQPPFANDKIYAATPVGVVMGLAWTSLGGSTLYVEAASVEKGEGKGSMKATGQLGDVMKESATIAHTFVRSYLADKSPGNDYFATNAIHVHVPAGATPKDGPSAGCTIITALLSLATNQPIKPQVAMTGEVTLTGKVLPIGGVKEKTLAAQRAEIREVIFPAGNRKDWDELEDEVKAGLTPHFVEQYDDIFGLVFEQQEILQNGEVAQQQQHMREGISQSEVSVDGT